MSNRSSRSADFIGGFKRYDYAIDIYPETYLLKLKGRFLRFPIKYDIISDKQFKTIVRCLNEFKSIMKNGQNIHIENSIKHIIFNPHLKDTHDFRMQLISVQHYAISTLSKIYYKSKLSPKKTTAEKRFKSQILFIDDDTLSILDYDTLLNYAKRMRNDYKSLKFRYIKKPSLDHLFNSTEKCKDKILRLRTIILLIQRDIKEFELLDYYSSLK